MASTSDVGAFAPLARQRAVLLTTYKKDGTPLGTPVNIVVEGDLAYVRSWDTAWKTKRIHHNPHVLVAPSTINGKQTGPAVAAIAHKIEGAEAKHAAQLIQRKHRLLQGVIVPLLHKLRHQRTVHFELEPETEAA